jgi:hypothetical protein
MIRQIFAFSAICTEQHRRLLIRTMHEGPSARRSDVHEEGSVTIEARPTLDLPDIHQALSPAAELFVIESVPAILLSFAATGIDVKIHQELMHRRSGDYLLRNPSACFDEFRRTRANAGIKEL